METQASLLDPHLVISDVLVRMNDEALRNGFTRGYYMSLIQKALKKLSMDTFYNQKTIGVPMPADFRWQVPDDFFNLVLLYAYNGDCCDVNAGSANIYFKRNFNNSPNGQGYTAMNKGSLQSANDPYFQLWMQEGGWSDNNNYLFANIQNGVLMLSNACSGYSNIQVTYNSLGPNIGDTPLIPSPLQSVITDLVCYDACLSYLAKYPKSQYGALFKIYDDKLYNRLSGTWWEGIDFIKNSHTWIKECNAIYAGNYGNW